MRRHHGRQQGFSLMELLIVMSVLTILATIAVPSYQRHLIKAREAVLAEDLFQMRQAIDKFFADNVRYPDNLEELVSAQYLRQLPEDPFTRSDRTWQVTAPEANEAGETVPGGVYDIASGSDLIGLNSVPYKEW
jgi:general secretion pathway protein G